MSANYIMFKKLIICTTAICRPEIHNICIPKVSDVLELLVGYNIYWIINIDNYSAHGITQEQTKNNFDLIISNKITKFFSLPTESSHPGAVNNIVNIIKSNNLLHDDNLYFWLEDDWKIDYEFNPNIILKYVYPKTWYSLAANYPGFNPSILGGNSVSNCV